MQANTDVDKCASLVSHFIYIKFQNTFMLKEARCQDSTENSHTGHWAHTSKSTNVKVQNIYRGK
jgi:hypothetical protein